MKSSRAIFFVLLILGGGYWWWSDPLRGPITEGLPPTAVHYRPAFPEPAGTGVWQSDPKVRHRFRHQGYVFTALKDFQVSARVLSSRRYTQDREADIAPVDLALGWGPMADPANLASISISQDRRFYFWSVRDFPIPREDIERHSANMHLIPASNEVRETLLEVAAGEEILLAGQLVHVATDDGYRWKSSTTRDDTGAGACEVIWVTRAEVRTPAWSDLGN